MKKREVTILGLSHSNTEEGSYVLVLAQDDGMTKLPVIIKQNDAQRIVLEVEGIPNKRPQIHDLFKSLSDAFSIDIQEVHIHSVLEGIFYTKLITTNGMDEFEFECSISDGVILSLIYACPIMVSQSVMASAGVLINDDGSPITSDNKKERKEKKRVVPIEDLEMMLEEAIKQEEFEIASTIRDRINELKEDI